MQFTLLAARISRGYSVEKVAGICKVGSKEIQNLESDSSDIEYGMLLRLANIYGVPPDLIYCGVTKE